MRTLETDYLIVGCGAAGMAFADALVADSDADVIMVDRRHAPGGHWHDAYTFVRLHQPSAYYGVNSLPLGADTIDRDGVNAGMYEQASAAEICAYYDRVMRTRLLPSGRVRYFPMSDYVGEHRLVARLTGETCAVKVRRALVDATYLEPAVPSTSAPPFAVEPGVRCVPVNALSRGAVRADRYVMIGAGKTAMDACVWLLQNGVPAEGICWIKPREAWLLNRTFAQSGELVGQLLEGLARQMEAAAQASSLDDLFARLDAGEQLLRVDEQVTPTMYKGPTMSVGELELLRRITSVVRLGAVRAIRQDTVVLDRGTLPAKPGDVYVHCAAAGLNPAPSVPIFSDGRITLQPIRVGLIPFNAAMVGYVEATRGDSGQRGLAEKNRLCPPNRLPDVPLDWIRGTLVAASADHAWSKEADIAAWLEKARLNPSRGLRQRASDPLVRDAMHRYGEHVRPALANLTRLLTDSPKLQ
jgi:hypothetical protein